jgi:hypothetical protein
MQDGKGKREGGRKTTIVYEKRSMQLHPHPHTSGKGRIFKNIFEV